MRVGWILGEVFSGREVQILGASHMVVERGCISWEGGVDSGRVTCSCGKESIFWEGRVDSERVAYICLNGGGGIFCEGGVDSGRDEY